MIDSFALLCFIFSMIIHLLNLPLPFPHYPTFGRGGGAFLLRTAIEDVSRLFQLLFFFDDFSGSSDRHWYWRSSWSYRYFARIVSNLSEFLFAQPPHTRLCLVTTSPSFLLFLFFCFFLFWYSLFLYHDHTDLALISFFLFLIYLVMLFVYTI